MSRSRTVLLLHGQPGSARDWDHVVAALGADQRSIALDRPGWDGRSGATDLAGNASAALAALKDEDDERAVVVGYSFGGAVAAWLAVHHPERVEALVLVAPSANTQALYRLDYLMAAPVVGPLLSAGVIAGAGAVLGRARIRHAIAGRLKVDDPYLDALARLVGKSASWRAFVVEQRALVRDLPELERGLHRISAPTVIVAGAADRIVPTAAAHALARQIAGAELVLISRAGHLLPHRHAERLAEIIAELPG